MNIVKVLGHSFQLSLYDKDLENPLLEMGVVVYTFNIKDIQLTKCHIFSHIFSLSKFKGLYNMEYLSELSTFHFLRP